VLLPESSATYLFFFAFCGGGSSSFRSFPFSQEELLSSLFIRFLEIFPYPLASKLQTIV
jgi:hypothetical protein